MGALAILYLVLPLPVLFLIHLLEEILLRRFSKPGNSDYVARRFPLLFSIQSLETDCGIVRYSMAALEKLTIILLITAYVLVQAPLRLEIWASAFMATAIHFLIQIVYSISLRRYSPGLVSSILALPYLLMGFHGIFLAMSPLSAICCLATGLLATSLNIRFTNWICQKS